MENIKTGLNVIKSLRPSIVENIKIISKYLDIETLDIKREVK